MNARAKFTLPGILGSLVILGFAAGILVVQNALDSQGHNAASAVDSTPATPNDSAAVPQDVQTGVLPDGRTYGPVPMPPLDFKGGEYKTPPPPDLVAIATDNGEIGYADSYLALGGEPNPPKTPEEALAQQRARNATGGLRIEVLNTEGERIGWATIE